MKLHTDNHGFEGNLPKNRMSMKIEQSAKMFSILSDGIYKDKIMAVVREYICNAYDAHVSVGKKDVPFMVRLPSYLDSTFSVIDEGSGVEPHGVDEDGNFAAHKNICDIFWTYARSSKTNDVDTIGALGLGSKSAFAYTKSSFIVKNRFNGMEYVYFCFINEQGEPEGSCVNEAPTTENNGITVEFAVRPEDNNAFYDRFGRLYKYWANVKPKIIGVDAEDLSLEQPKKVVEGTDWYLEACENYYDRHSALAIMGNVAYPIESSSIPNLPSSLKVIADNAFIITFPLGELEFASSREALSYTEFTCKQLIARLEQVRAELAESFHDKVFKASKDHLSFYHTFNQTFAEFRKVVNVSTKFGEESNEVYAQMLLGHALKDAVEFQGVNFPISNLIEGKWFLNRDFYQNFGMYSATTRSARSNRYFLAPATTLTAKLKDKSSTALWFPERSYVHDLKAGEEIIDRHDWRACHVSKRLSNPTTIDLVIKSLDKFDVITENGFKIDKNEQLTFVINDVGSTGRDRFKSLAIDSSVKENFKLGQLVYVEFNPKVNTIEEVLIDLKNVIGLSLTGTTIKHLSDLPDLRPPMAKVKIAKESIKLKVMTFTEDSTIGIPVAEDYLENGMELEVADLFKTLKEQILTLGELKARKVVPFIIKRRSAKNFFADVGSSEPAITRDLELPAHVGCFDEAFIEENVPVTVQVNTKTLESVQKKQKSLNVLIINESQHIYLKKKGVKLVALKTMIATKIEALQATEKFTETIQRVITLSKVNILKGVYQGMSGSTGKKLIADLANSTSLFKSLFREYCDQQVQSKKFALDFAKLEVLKMVKNVGYFNNDGAAEKIQHSIVAQYPMLELINFYNMDKKRDKIITYVEQIDALIEKAIVEAKEEVKEIV